MKQNVKDVRSELPNPPGMSPLNSQVTEQEQELYKDLSLNALKILYKDDKITDDLITQLESKTKQDPAKGLAFVSKLVVDNAKKHTKPGRMQGKILPEMVTRLTNNIVGEVAKLGTTAGIPGLQEGTVKKDALQLALGATIRQDTEAGAINPESLMNFAVGHANRANQMRAKEGK